MPEEQNKEALAPTQSAELTPEDKKIAAKRAKKKNIDPEIAEQARLQEKNAGQAQGLTLEYHEKLSALGFVLEPVIEYSNKYIKASFDLRPMNAGEMMNYKQTMEFRAKAEAAKKEKEGVKVDVESTPEVAAE